MNPGKIAGANHDFGAPRDWNERLQGPCATLPVAKRVGQMGVELASAWYPSPEEIDAMRQGCPVILTILGSQHPVVMMGVAAIPAAAEQMCFHGNTAREGCPQCAAEDAGIDARLVIPSDFGKKQ